MTSPQIGRFKRSMAAALTAVLATMVSVTAFAADAEGAPTGADAAAESSTSATDSPAHAKKAKHHKKHAAKPSKEARGAKPPKGNHATSEKGSKETGSKDAKGSKEAKEPKEAKEAKLPSLSSATPNAKAATKAKKTGSRHGAKKKTASTQKSEEKAPPRGRGSKPKPCFGPPVTIERGGVESATLSLLTCAGAPIAAARDTVSVLARPWSVAKPDLEHARKHPHAKGHAGAEDEVAPGIRAIDPGLLTRLDRISQNFQGKPFSFVSGYRPQSKGSLHQAGRAIDLHIANVPNEELVAFCRTIPDTGCGYYPNSSFVHVDVRKSGAGRAFWIDASGPGEAPHYVSEWPPKPESTPSNAAKVDAVDDEAPGHGTDSEPSLPSLSHNASALPTLPESTDAPKHESDSTAAH